MDSDRPYAGRFVSGEHRFAVRVYYDDTDAGGVVYHANYLRFFERARMDMLALLGIDAVDALKVAGGYVVAEVSLKYLLPAKLGDALIVTSAIETIGASSCVIQQRVMRDGAMIADGRVRIVFVSPDGRPRRQPAMWIEAFARARGGATDG